MNATEQSEIYTELVKHVYSVEPIALAATGINAAILCGVLWPVVPHTILTAWFAGMLVWVGFRVFLRYCLRRISITPDNFSRRSDQLVIVTGLSGFMKAVARALVKYHGVGHGLFGQ